MGPQQWRRGRDPHRAAAPAALRADDLPAFVTYRSAPEVARYQSWDPTYTIAEAEQLLASQQEVVFGQPGAWVQLAAIHRVTGALCGDCAVRVVTDQPATAELGVTLAPEHQGAGLAGEALAAVIRRLFEDYGIHRIYAEADDRNVAVQRLLERLGFRCEARLVEADWFKREWSTLRVYAVLRREWETRKPAPACNGGEGPPGSRRPLLPHAVSRAGGRARGP